MTLIFVVQSVLCTTSTVDLVKYTTISAIVSTAHSNLFANAIFGHCLGCARLQGKPEESITVYFFFFLATENLDIR